jgi:GNAT superfamily N-acetyltransferase
MSSKFLPGVIRRLWSTDKTEFRDHLLRLDPESRRSRFAMGVDDSFIERYAEASFRLDGVVYAYFEAGKIRALAELRPLGEHDVAEMEAAFSVEPEWRRKGIAAALFRRIIDAARRRGKRRLYTTCLATNEAMKALALKFDGELTLEGSDVMAIVETPPKASLAGALGGAIDDAAAFAIAVLDIERRWFGRGN